MTTSDFNANWASPPGETIKRLLHSKNVCMDEFSSKVQLTPIEINGLFSGAIRINESLAEKFETYLGGSASFWVNRDERYMSQLQLITSRKKENEDWMKLLPIKDMIKMGWIKGTGDLIESCLNFFNVKSKGEWELKYGEVIANSMFRTSATLNENTGALITWLRQGEIVADKINCKKWNSETLENSIPELRKLTRLKSPKEFLPELIDICASTGVAISIIKAPVGCRSSGVTRFINDDKAILQLSFRYLVDDQFWFTFFHEIGHLIMHGKDKIYMEPSSIKEYVESDEEREANLFAQAALIPYKYEDVLKTMPRDKRTIINLASELGISPGILIGQLQHREIIKFSYLNGYKRRYDWDEISDSLLY